MPNSRQVRPAHVLLGAFILTTGILGGCSSSPFTQRSFSLAEAQAAYQRQDYWTAAQMLRPLAYQGNADAQYALGYMYYYGRGVERNRGFAMSWFGEAVRLGHEKAREALAQVQSEARIFRLPAQMPAGDAPGRSGAVQTAARPRETPVRPVQAADAGRKSRIEPHVPAHLSGGVEPAPGLLRQGSRPAVVNAALAGGDGEAGAGTEQPENSRPRTADAALESGLPSEAAPVGSAADGPGRREASRAAGSSAPARIRPAPSPKPRRDEGRAPGILAGNPRFTLQLIGSRSREDLVRLVERYGLEQVRYLRGERRGAPWYRLIYSGFDTLAEARRALKALPPGMARHRPYVRNFPRAQMAALRRID